MSHGPHPDVHEEGLQDGCDACLEAAQKPLEMLDRGVLGRLMMAVVHREVPRSEAEALAQTNVERALHGAGKLAATSPGLVERYLLDRWHIEASIG